jgi:hypothetical protein
MDLIVHLVILLEEEECRMVPEARGVEEGDCREEEEDSRVREGQEAEEEEAEAHRGGSRGRGGLVVGKWGDHQEGSKVRGDQG